MITIEKLNPRQMQIAELLWQCTTEEEVKDLVLALPTVRDQVDASSMIKLMLWDSTEYELGFNGEVLDAADNAIAHAMR